MSTTQFTPGMTITQALHHGRSHIPPLDARLLLQHLLNCTHAQLLLRGDDTLTAAQTAAYQQLLDRAKRGEPIPYITGRAPFFDIELTVTPDVLIPRPETEELVQRAIDWAKPRQPLHIIDVGTGSGCIPIILARHLPQATLEATDISPAALAVAQANASQFAPNRIHFHHGNLLLPTTRPPDLITANLPYITDAEWTQLDDGVKSYEPVVALRGGHDGLRLIDQLLHQATTRLRPGGIIFLEIGWQQGKLATELAQTIFPATAVTLTQDLAGHDRIVIINQPKL